ncbi:HAD-IC family P-type ATPase [Actinocrinis sp.]|uniref:HAD-IC family P-type ATPase n=1 Tax=Actinocrinis sp. TaxID=1920516 RepID=UPI002D687510|nr:HAD-IC family P-type ATPase [Actinocrinis sp.]HZP54116.1 HAD-IC family P-type ATPase [Actinocrinis sp.]
MTIEPLLPESPTLPFDTRGLTAAQVAERVADGRVNEVPVRSSRSAAAILRANVLTWFNGLIGALFAIMLVVAPIQDALFGFVIVFNAAIGIVQEWRAKRTLDSLAIVGEARPRVRRDGAEVQVAASELVQDDLVLLAVGDKIPVDGLVLEAEALEVDESLLTGEADPVTKRPGDAQHGANELHGADELHGAHELHGANQLLSGSFVVAGSGTMLATRVGPDAHAAKLAAEAQQFTLVRSQLRDGINRILRYLTYLLIPAAALQVVVQAGVAGGFSRDGISRTVAGIVPMVPEGLVLLTSVAFAVGVVRLGRRQCLVQELPAIEGLARVDVVCLDKTGTLTEGGMRLAEVKVLDSGEKEPDVRRVLGALGAAEERPNATMAAVIEACPDPGGWQPQTVAAFSSARKWSGVAFADGRGTWLFGAPDVLGRGTGAAAQAERLGASGLRVLMLASYTGPLPADGSADLVSAEVRPVALVTLEQRIRDDAAPTLEYFARQSVALKVISGDNAVSVGAVAGSLGLPGAEHPVDARDLPEDPEALAAAVEANSVFGRVTPRQKQQMVAALQSRGHTVAMTGDGVNDVLALKSADIGVAMGSGSGAARAVAQIVLLDERFATLPSVVAEGRRVVGNVERVSNLFLVKSFESFLMVVLVGVARLPYPFLPRHTTLISTLTIGTPAFFLALAPNLSRARSGFVARVLRFAIPAGLIAGAASFISYYLARLEPGAQLAVEQTSAMVTLFAVGIWVLALVARPFAWWKAALIGAMAGGFVLVALLPAGRRVFDLHFGGWQQTLTALAVAGCAAVALEVVWRLDVRRTARMPVPDGGD